MSNLLNLDNPFITSSQPDQRAESSYRDEYNPRKMAPTSDDQGQSCARQERECNHQQEGLRDSDADDRAGQDHQDCRETPPSDCGEVPCEPDCLPSEPVRPEQSGKVRPSQQPYDDVLLAKPGMGNANPYSEKGG